MGHLLSAGKLANLIVQLQSNISVLVLIISNPFDSTSIKAYVDSQSKSRDPSSCLSFVSLPALSNPPDLTSKKALFATLIDLYKPIVKRAVMDRVESGSSRPAGFILDMFCTAFMDVANELGVPSFVFFTSGAYALSYLFHTQSLVDDGSIHFADVFNDPIKELRIPGFRDPVPWKVSPGDKEGGAEILFQHARRFREARGILVNTYMELETYGIKAMLEQSAIKDEQIPVVYPVGPILEFDDEIRGGSQKNEEDQYDSIIDWLDQQPPSSVVFLCFGSMGSFDEVQVKEIANGLERAGHRFLWSLRRPPPDSGKIALPSKHETYVEALPEGFLERTAERGKVIGWAPQVAILAHRAVGGFVSHCGWNSTLESLWFGVPMATWPMYAEQQLNAFTLVKELGLAVEIRMDYRKDLRARQGNFVVKAEEIEDGVKRLMGMDEGMREKVGKMSDKGRQALKQGGSSRHWLGRFIADMLDNTVA